jgi:hypothetical protein
VASHLATPRSSRHEGNVGQAPRLENLDELLIKSERVCYTAVIHGLYQHFAGITIIFYPLQKGTNT